VSIKTCVTDNTFILHKALSGLVTFLGNGRNIIIDVIIPQSFPCTLHSTPIIIMTN